MAVDGHYLPVVSNRFGVQKEAVGFEHAERHMTFTDHRLTELVESELAELDDARVTAHVRHLLVPPSPVMRGWDYGTGDEAYPCWSVLEHKSSNTGIAYCESGFGPSSPWGLVFLAGAEHMSIGMDSSWFRRFLDAYFDSKAACELPVWRVFRGRDGDSVSHPISAEGAWQSTWSEVERLRALHPDVRYNCSQSLYRGDA